MADEPKTTGSGGFRPSLKTVQEAVTRKAAFLASEHHSSKVGGVTLDWSLVPEDDNGDRIVESGTLVSEITSAGQGGTVGKYAPYGGVTNEIQSITVDATGGTFTVSWDGEGPTAAIAFDASAADFKAALVALANINDDDIEVAGGPGDAGGNNPYTIEFMGQYGGTDVAQVTTDGGLLTGGLGTAVPATDQAGGAAATDGRDVAKYQMYDEVNLRDGDVIVAVMTHGTSYQARTPNYDAGAATDLAGRILFV